MKSGLEIYITISYVNFKYLKPHLLKLLDLARFKVRCWENHCLSQERKIFLSRVVATHSVVIIPNTGLTLQSKRHN